MHTGFTGISRDCSEKLSPTFPLSFCHSRDTCVHLLKLDIIWIVTAHCSQNTFKETHILEMSVKLVSVSTTQHNRVPMSWWAILNVFWDWLFIMFLSYICVNLYISVNYYIMKWHEVSLHTWVISGAVALWLTLVHWIHWTHFTTASTQPTRCSFRDTHHDLKIQKINDSKWWQDIIYPLHLY